MQYIYVLTIYIQYIHIYIYIVYIYIYIYIYIIYMYLLYKQYIYIYIYNVYIAYIFSKYKKLVLAIQPRLSVLASSLLYSFQHFCKKSFTQSGNLINHKALKVSFRLHITVGLLASFFSHPSPETFFKKIYLKMVIFIFIHSRITRKIFSIKYECLKWEQDFIN